MKSRKVCLADFSRFFIFYEMLTGRGKAEYSDCTKKLEDKNVR